MTIAIIGSGNVATVIGRLALNSEHVVVHVASRHEEKAAMLAKDLGANYSDYNKMQDIKADVIIVAVADKAIENCVRMLQPSDSLVVHTAGSVSISVLQERCKHFGVLYPLQSLRKEILPSVDVPFLIDGNSEEVKEQVARFALTLSNNVTYAHDEARLKLHAAAVIVSNFTNHLYVLTEAFCKKENIAFETLLPLINETTSRLSSFSPTALQTGPAFRKDSETLSKHRQIFQDHPSLQKMYDLFSESIIREHP